MTKSQKSGQMAQIAPVVSPKTTRADGFVSTGVEKYWPRLDEHEMHDVFVVISEGANGEHIARTVFAADPDDARQAHHENYADEVIVAVDQ